MLSVVQVHVRGSTMFFKGCLMGMEIDYSKYNITQIAELV